MMAFILQHQKVTALQASAIDRAEFPAIITPSLIFWNSYPRTPQAVSCSRRKIWGRIALVVLGFWRSCVTIIIRFRDSAARLWRVERLPYDDTGMDTERRGEGVVLFQVPDKDAFSMWVVSGGASTKEKWDRIFLIFSWVYLNEVS